MANFNKVILAGNLTRDPQLSYLPNNTPACEFGMAINRKWRGQDGEMRDETCFVELRLYGRQAETFNQYMSKGRPVLVEGRLKFDQWEGKDGAKRSKLYVIAERFQFLGGPRDGGEGRGRGEVSDVGRPPAPAPARAAEGHGAPAPSAEGYGAPPSGGPGEEMPPPVDPTPAGGEIPF